MFSYFSGGIGQKISQKWWFVYKLPVTNTKVFKTYFCLGGCHTPSEGFTGLADKTEVQCSCQGLVYLQTTERKDRLSGLLLMSIPYEKHVDYNFKNIHAPRSLEKGLLLLNNSLNPSSPNPGSAPVGNVEMGQLWEGSLRGFINVFSQKAIGFHRWGKSIWTELFFNYKNNFPPDGQTRQEKAGQFAQWLALKETPSLLPSHQ